MFEFGEDLCPHCFQHGFDGEKCNACGFEQVKSKNNANCLPPFTILDGRYLLGHCIGAGGFGITYTAYCFNTNTRCAIKEYFPCSIADRSQGTEAVYCDKENQFEYSHGLQRFYDEAKTLATLRWENGIVDIMEYLKANNTAYIVMEFVDGVTIKKYMYNRKKTFSYAETKKIFKDVAVALEKVHIKKLLHRDLTPENIMIQKNGSVKIVDFGSARDYVRNATGMSVLIKRGYAPFEQYSSEKKQGPYTDIYSFCCTIYYMLSGRIVPEAPDRINGTEVPRLDTIVPDVPKRFAMMIEKGMSVMPSDRYTSVGEMLMEMQEIERKENPQEVLLDAPKAEPEIKPVVKEKTGFWHRVKVFFGFVEEEKKENIVKYKADESNENIVRYNAEEKSFNPSSGKKRPEFVPFHLIIDEGPASGFDYTISADGIYTVGRSESQCDAVIGGDIPQISRLHCIITSQNHGTDIFVEDKSANGTIVDRYGILEKGHQYSIAPGDTLYLATRKNVMRIVR